MEKEFNIVPLSGGYMITSMVGFFISVFYIYPQHKPWGFALSVFFVIMFISAVISMTYAPSEWPLKKEKRL